MTDDMNTQDWVWLRGAHLNLAVDRQTGSLVALEAAENDWEIQGRPALGVGFRLLLPLAGRRNNPVRNEDQSPPTVSRRQDGRQITLVWDGVRSVHGGHHPIRVTQTVTLEGRQAVFAITIDNHSELTVENVWAPYLGDVRPPSETDELRTFFSNYNSAKVRNLYPTFEGIPGYWGVDSPIQLGGQDGEVGVGVVPVSPFMLVLARDQGLYFGVASPDCEVVAWWAELYPGFEDSMSGMTPPLDRIASHDVAIRMAVGHVPFILPGESRALTPIAIEPFMGDWHAGADIYTSWRSTWMHAAVPPAWATEPNSWLQFQVNSPEDELRIAFRDLPRIATECAETGIGVIQLVGWNDGGQDQGNPSHRPDPRLGTPEELANAIRECQALGVRIILFSKFVWADSGTDRYLPDYAADAIVDPRGDPYPPTWYRYQTLTQLLGVSVKHLVPMCFASEHYLQACEVEFQRMLDLGADGVLVDEALNHQPAWLCFSPDHGHHEPTSVYANDAELISRFRARSDAARPDFLYVGEGLYDWLFETYDASYFRSSDPNHVPLGRYLLPYAPLMTAVTGFDDRNMVNQCLLYRYLISYEPFNFKGRPSDAPATVEYGRKMDALRTDLRGWFWDGLFRDTVGGRVTDAAGKTHHPFSVFLHSETRQPGIAVANYGRNPIELTIDADELDDTLVYRLVDGDEWLDASAGVSLPARSAAVVLSARAADRTAG